MKKRVLKLTYKPHCYILISFPKREDPFGEYRVNSVVSFVYDAGDIAAEWEAEHGPIQIWHKCKKDAQDAREHYFYNYTDSGPGNWSQLAVDHNQLPQAANRGDYDYIFAVLEDWTVYR